MGFISELHTLRDWVVTSPGGTQIVFKQDTGRCDRFPYVDICDPEVERLFGDIQKENIANTTAKMLSEHFVAPKPYHGDASFCAYSGKITADDWVTGTKEVIGGVSLF